MLPIYKPGTCLSSMLGVEPSKTRSFENQTRVIWVLVFFLLASHMTCLWWHYDNEIIFYDCGKSLIILWSGTIPSPTPILGPWSQACVILTPLFGENARFDYSLYIVFSYGLKKNDCWKVSNTGFDFKYWLFSPFKIPILTSRVVLVSNGLKLPPSSIFLIEERYPTPCSFRMAPYY